MRLVLYHKNIILFRKSKSHFTISQFGNSDYDALWDGVTGDIMHKPNGDIPRDL